MEWMKKEEMGIEKEGVKEWDEMKGGEVVKWWEEEGINKFG